MKRLGHIQAPYEPPESPVVADTRTYLPVRASDFSVLGDSATVDIVDTPEGVRITSVRQSTWSTRIICNLPFPISSANRKVKFTTTNQDNSVTTPIFMVGFVNLGVTSPSYTALKASSFFSNFQLYHYRGSSNRGLRGYIHTGDGYEFCCTCTGTYYELSMADKVMYRYPYAPTIENQVSVAVYRGLDMIIREMSYE